MAAKPAVIQQVDAVLKKLETIEDPIARAQKVKDEANQFFKGIIFVISS